VSARLKLEVRLLSAKPNRMFPEWMTERVRFLRFSDSVPCAECGRKRKHHWTMLCAFQAHTMAPLIAKKSGTVHLPLAAVCRQHLLAPEVTESEPQRCEVQP
jgi:hypothetical protein